MRIERRITFVIGSDGFAAWKLSRLKTLASYFRSVVIFRNISQGKSSNAEHSLKVISIGSRENDLCQLWMEGSDAELACMVLTDFIADEFNIVNTSHRKTEEFSNSVIETHPTFSLPFPLSYTYEKLGADSVADKQTLLIRLSRMLSADNAQRIYEAMERREAISSTCIGNGIALPHIMLADIEQTAIAVLKTEQATDWHSERGSVDTIIAILIPAPAQMPVIKACTQMTRALLDPDFCRLLSSTVEPEALKAIIRHIMARGPLPSPSA